MLKHSFESGILPPSLRHGIITLACKDVNAADLLTNWRPISLLNVDYKILAKVLSKRLSAVLPQCIHPDQTCAVPGRSIQDNLHLFRNVTDYANDNDKAAAIVSYDQAKAFDRVSCLKCCLPLALVIILLTGSRYCTEIFLVASL